MFKVGDVVKVLNVDRSSAHPKLVNNSWRVAYVHFFGLNSTSNHVTLDAQLNSNAVYFSEIQLIPRIKMRRKIK